MLVGERLHAAGQYQAALDWLWVALPYNATSPVSSYDPINTELVMPTPAGADLTFPPDWTGDLNPFHLVYTGNDPYPYRPYTWIRNTLLAIISCLADYADSEFSAYTAESVAHARDLYATATRLLAHPSLQPVTAVQPRRGRAADPAAADPRITRVSNQLAKLRQDRDIAGLPQTQAVTTGDPISQPTPYHFKVLLARAQQLTQQAATIEAEYLSALEKYDNKTLQLSDAQNAAKVAALQLNVHAARCRKPPTPSPRPPRNRQKQPRCPPSTTPRSTPRPTSTNRACSATTATCGLPRTSSPAPTRRSVSPKQ